MYSKSVLVALVAGFLAPAAAAPAPMATSMPYNPFHLATPVCGPSNSTGNGICVDHGAITSKAFARYESDSKHYFFSQCKAACQTNDKCASIAYYNTDDYDGNKWVCELLSEPITPYTISCGNPKYGPGATPFAQNNSRIGQVFNPASLNVSALSNYFEKSCASNVLQMKTGGTVPAADSDKLLCGAYTTTQQSYADIFMTAPNMNQTACRDLCKGTAKCKSYFWARFTTPTKQPFGQDQQDEPEIKGDCAFFSQPIKEHAIFSEYPLPIFDINCKPGNGTF